MSRGKLPMSRISTPRIKEKLLFEGEDLAWEKRKIGWNGVRLREAEVRNFSYPESPFFKVRGSLTSGKKRFFVDSFTRKKNRFLLFFPVNESRENKRLFRT